ncbi:helix-turn-helix domain-containing protein [Phormidesmis sp. 146-33]
MLTLTYEFKLVPTSDQAALIEQWLIVCRKVWNYALRERKDWIESRKCEVNACSIRREYIIPADAPSPNFAHQCKSLTDAKTTNPELKAVNETYAGCWIWSISQSDIALGVLEARGAFWQGEP